MPETDRQFQSHPKLLQELRHRTDVNPGHLGFSLADAAAALDNLRLTYLEYYGGMTDARRSEILKGVFGVET